MKISFLFNQKTIVIKAKKDKNVEEINKIFEISLGKYKNYLTFKSQEENKDDSKSLKLISEKNINHSRFYVIEKQSFNSNKPVTNRIRIKYKISSYNKRIKIFGETFTEINKNNCYMLNNGIKYKLNSYFDIKNNKEKQLIIELIWTKRVKNLKGMFIECTSLESIPDFSNLNTNNVTNISFLFYTLKFLVINSFFIPFINKIFFSFIS